ncbi:MULTISPECIES: hypothetical protein [unclassified Brevundimonas]|nr:MULTISPECIES: hypothetical protein [unclassified Brevundimonas]HBI20558.1 hypothetical protein [Brevundimonas sp.]
MSPKGRIKEAAGFLREELDEQGDSAEAQRKVPAGRDLRNEARIEDGKAPKTSEPGAGHRKN